MRLNDYLIQRPSILFLLDFNNFVVCQYIVCYVSVHSLCVAQRKAASADSCNPMHTLLSVRYFIAPVSTFLTHLEVGCVVERRAVKQCWLTRFAVRVPLVSFRFIIAFPAHAYEANTTII